jgi:hypothetical protein
LICQLLLGFEDIAKFFFVPYFESLLDVLKLLLKLVHWGARVWVKFCPPEFYVFLEVGVIEPKAFRIRMAQLKGLPLRSSSSLIGQ